MAPNLHFSLCLDEIEEKDALTIVTGIMAQMKAK